MMDVAASMRRRCTALSRTMRQWYSMFAAVGTTSMSAPMYSMPPARSRSPRRPSSSRSVTHREDHLRLQQVDLPEQIGRAGRGFVVLRRAVLGRAALHHVTDEDLLALHVDRREDLGQQLAGLTHERAPGFVFRPARSFSHHDE